MLGNTGGKLCNKKPHYATFKIKIFEGMFD